jgi:hypothetical protein
MAEGYGTCSSGRSGQMDVITIEGMMETFAAIVVAVVIVALVFLGIIFVEVLTGFIASFL